MRYPKRSFAWVVTFCSGWAAVVGCETSPSKPALPAAPPPTSRQSTAPAFGPPPAAQRGYFRYRGTLGGRPVQLELTVEPITSPDPQSMVNANVDGWFRYLDSDAEEGLDIPTQGCLVSKPLEIEDKSHEAILCTDQPVGPLLTGTYQLNGHRVSFRVREDYSDCLRYEILEELTGAHEQDSSAVSCIKRCYVHLLGADTLRPAWARLQCPPPARRAQARARLVKRLALDPQELGPQEQRNEYLELSLNQADLFAYSVEERQEYTFSSHYGTTTRQVLYDLRAGRQLRLLDQLRPGGRRRLLQLLTRQALADTVGANRRDVWRQGQKTMPFPAEGFAVTPEGLVARYRQTEADPNSYYYVQTLSWEALRPLLRPASPLRRLLKPARQSSPAPKAPGVGYSSRPNSLRYASRRGAGPSGT